MRVTGKGAKTRTVFVPRPAMEALQTYLAQRGLGGLESAPPNTPLLASTLDGMAPIARPNAPALWVHFPPTTTWK